MNQQRFLRLRRAAESALELEGEARQRALEEALGDEQDLLAEAHELIAAAEASEGFLDTPGAAPGELADGSPGEGRVLGRYRLVRKLGEGGMGAVYLAERSDGEFAKPVALKVAYRAAWDEELHWRVRRERQILARLEHPHIARLYDGGTWEGVPYFAMELVEGLPIDDYCRHQRLPLASRLELFLEVCDAVGFAHRSLVVHRDLKPANILVTHEGEPKLLDFGIAKALTADEGGSATRLGQGPLTPSYASPEQLRGETVSTASDLYSLGVILFQLITGDLPRRLNAFDLVDLEATFAAQPPRPSVTAKERTSVGPRRSWRDLDAIVDRAIASDPAQRYPTTEHLAADLRAFLACRPVVARRTGLGHRIGLYVRRHRLRTAAAAVVLLTAVAALCHSSLQSQEILRQRDRALVESRRANETVAFLVDILENTDPARTGSGRPEPLVFATDQIRQRLHDHPLLRARLLETVGQLHLRLGKPDLAHALTAEALDLYRRHGSPRLPSATAKLAAALTALGRYDEAEAHYRTALDDPRLTREGRAESLSGLAIAHYYSGRFEAAVAPLEEALHLLGEGGDHNELRALTLNRLGLVTAVRTGMAAAETWHSQALELQRETLGPEHPAIAQTLVYLARTQEKRGDLQAAGTNLRQALDLRRAAYGGQSPLVGETLLEYSRWLHGSDDLPASRRALEEGCALLAAARGTTHRDAAACDLGLGQIELASGHLDRAEELLQRSLEEFRQRYDEGHHAMAFPLRQLAIVAARRGDFASARDRLEAGLRSTSGALPDEVPFVAEMQVDLGRVLAELGEIDEARQWLTTAAANLEQRLGHDNPQVAAVRARLAALPAAPIVNR